jgi:hypothetical protein
MESGIWSELSRDMKHDQCKSLTSSINDFQYNTECPAASTSQAPKEVRVLMRVGGYKLTKGIH